MTSGRAPVDEEVVISFYITVVIYHHSADNLQLIKFNINHFPLLCIALIPLTLTNLIQLNQNG